MSGINESTDAVKHVVGPASAVKHVAPYRYPLAEADAARMAELSAEIADRLAEMERIFTVTTGEAPRDAAPRFVPAPGHAAAEADSDVTYVEIICGPEGCGCYVTLADGTGFCEYPCGG
ncbi:hypothetical protein [Dactylosporangium salmoneum]|uniref:Uncharacterized protein n=1 Tax=Dactylosporangium salmoneum TaxID=53361 RepID=A0ABN3FQU4_9ACTN